MNNKRSHPYIIKTFRMRDLKAYIIWSEFDMNTNQHINFKSIEPANVVGTNINHEVFFFDSSCPFKKVFLI